MWQACAARVATDAGARACSICQRMAHEAPGCDGSRVDGRSMGAVAEIAARSVETAGKTRPRVLVDDFSTLLVGLSTVIPVRAGGCAAHGVLVPWLSGATAALYAWASVPGSRVPGVACRAACAE